MKATLHMPGKTAQPLTLTENTRQAAGALLGLDTKKVEVMHHNSCPVHGCTIYVDGSTNPNMSWDKYAAKHPFLIVQG